MNPVFHFSKSKEICSASIGIEPAGNTHCGLLYNSDKGPRFLHLGSPLELFNDPETPNNEGNKGYLIKYGQYRWLPFQNLLPAKQNLIKTKCILIAEANKSLPFGIFTDEETNFDAKGNFKLGKDSTGLTCATFVRIVIRSINLEIIDDSDWPSDRPVDLIWLKNTIKYNEDRINYIRKSLGNIEKELKGSTNFTQMHILRFQRTNALADIETLIKTIKGLKEGLDYYFLRFRPEEVAGVCYEDTKEMPFKFEYSNSEKKGAGKIGEDLLHYLQTEGKVA